MQFQEESSPVTRSMSKRKRIATTSRLQSTSPEEVFSKGDTTNVEEDDVQESQTDVPGVKLRKVLTNVSSEY